jgi:hypothetical protein
VHTFADILSIAVGVALIVFVVDAAVRTFVVPRGTVVFLTAIVFLAVRYALAPFMPARAGYERRDRVMAIYAPLALLMLPVISLFIVFFAYAFMFAGLEHQGWHDALLMSGSSLFTLGFLEPHALPSAFVSFSEAAIGLGLLALLIAYLPTIYNTFSKRETAVTDLSIRAGTPPTVAEFLVRAHLTGFLLEMDGFWSAWMAWFTEVQETHTSYGALVFFRSPHPHRNWVTAAGAVLDTASVRAAVLDIPFSAAAPLCIRSGYLALREVAGFYGFEFDSDPSPTDPISIARDEFDEMCASLEARGVPLKADRDQAWRDFAGWRVNYDQVLHALAALVLAPYAPWVSDRSPRRSARRYRVGRRRREMARASTPLEPPKASR